MLQKSCHITDLTKKIYYGGRGCRNRERDTHTQREIGGTESERQTEQEREKQ